MKRDQSAADVSFTSFPSSGMKRSVRDRIDTDSSMLHGKELGNNKRYFAISLVHFAATVFSPAMLSIMIDYALCSKAFSVCSEALPYIMFE